MTRDAGLSEQLLGREAASHASRGRRLVMPDYAEVIRAANGQHIPAADLLQPLRRHLGSVGLSIVPINPADPYTRRILDDIESGLNDNDAFSPIFVSADGTTTYPSSLTRKEQSPHYRSDTDTRDHTGFWPVDALVIPASCPEEVEVLTHRRLAVSASLLLVNQEGPCYPKVSQQLASEPDHLAIFFRTGENAYAPLE